MLIKCLKKKYLLLFFILFSFEIGYSKDSFLLTYPEVIMMKESNRNIYFRTISKALLKFKTRSEKRNKTVFQILFQTVYAAGGYRCVSGGAPVAAGQQCGLQSYAGYTCETGFKICNPFLYGVKPDGNNDPADNKPFCYPNSISDLSQKCFDNIIVVRDSDFEPVFKLAGNESAYNQFVEDMDKICHHVDYRNKAPIVDIVEGPRTLRKACLTVRRQTDHNRKKLLKGFPPITIVAPCTSGNCSDENTGAMTHPSSGGIVPEDCEIELGGEKVNCNSKSLTQRTWDGVKKMVCLHQKSSYDFCPSSAQDRSANSINGYLERVEIAADIMGLDKRQLACLTLAKSGFDKNAFSNDFRKGLAQLTTTSAKQYSNRIKQSYQTEWTEFQDRTGENFPLMFVESSNITNGHPSYGIFAMAAFLKDSTHSFNGGTIAGWKTYVQKDESDFINYFHAQIAAHSWPNKTKEFLQHTTAGNRMSDYGLVTDSEAKLFMEKFDQCMYSDQGWSFLGSRPDGSRQQQCKIVENSGICSGDTNSNSEMFFEDYAPQNEESIGTI